MTGYNRTPLMTRSRGTLYHTGYNYSTPNPATSHEVHVNYIIYRDDTGKTASK